jgi:hypothetical protein
MDLVSRAYRTLGQEFVYFMSHSKCISRAQHSSIANQPITLISRGPQQQKVAENAARHKTLVKFIISKSPQLGGC